MRIAFSIRSFALIASCLCIHSVTHAQPGTITTIAGNGTLGYGGDGGPATAAILAEPGYLSWGYYGGFGTLYLNDASNNRIRQIKIGAIIRTVAGNGSTTYTGDGTLATANGISRAGGVCVDRHGNVYFADQYNYAIRKISISGIVTTVAGTGSMGCTGDNGPATNATLGLPYALSADTAGNIYFGDQTCQTVRKISTAGIISTVAGTGTAGYNGDGIDATSAKLNYPTYVRADTLGQLFITDNSNQRIRKINSAGVISTIAGNGTVGFSGDGGLATNAQINYAGGIGFDSYGNIYIADAYNYRIREVELATGKIYTIAGNGTPGYYGDNGPATAAELNNPADVVVDNHNDIYIADWHNSVLRKVEALTSPTKLECIISQSNISFYPNPTNGIIQMGWQNFTPCAADLQIFDLMGRVVRREKIEIVRSDGNAEVDLSSLDNGMYVAVVNGNNANIRQMIVLSR